MSGTTSTVFSEYEVRQISLKIGEGQALLVPCVGNFEEEMEVKTVTKNCRGKVAKTRSRGTGNGTITISAHIPKDAYYALHAMARDDLKTGIYAFGEKSLLPEAILCADVFDEDDNEKLKAYPRATVTTGPARSVENGADEVAEVEIEVAVSPDDSGEGLYECIVDELEKDEAETVKSQWMESFSRDLVEVAIA